MYSLFDYQMRLDLAKGFPLLTAERVSFGLIKSKLSWFSKGDTNIRYLLKRNDHIWDEWVLECYAKSTDYQGSDMTDFGHRVLQDLAFAEQYKEEHQKFCDTTLGDVGFVERYGELGSIYGTQWRHWEIKDGSFIGQLANVIETIKTNPGSCRLIVSAWSPEDMPSMVLPSYHTMFQFYVNEGKLSYQFYQRSVDVFLDVPLNIVGYALLTRLVAYETGLEMGELICTLGDAHLHQNHAEQMQE